MNMLSNLPTFQSNLYQSSYGKQIKRKGLKRNEMYTESQIGLNQLGNKSSGLFFFKVTC